MKIKNFLVKIMVMLVIFTTFSYKTNEIKINNSKEQIVENFLSAIAVTEYNGVLLYYKVRRNVCKP